ncbi:MAG TPA: DNA-formamidopyrimidine glycosylase family protein [Dehalococcoidia bacterium]|nr:DNA-formamidopyrimidine glycosylase family protein [Dehalococcoidia bacterium]
MPEIPDLEGYASYLNRRLPGRKVERVQVYIPIPVRAGAQELADTLEGKTIGEAGRIGKYLLFPFSDGAPFLVIHPMLTGRFQLAQPADKKPAKTIFALTLDGEELRYFDGRLMGKVYLAQEDELAKKVPRWTEMGPDALDPSLTEEVFRKRLHAYRGQIKSVLTKEQFVAGIGNAYSDEILFAAGIHPYRRRTDLSEEQESCLYRAMHEVLAWATPIVKERMEKDGLPRDHYRDHLRVHRKGGQPCPNCSNSISEITANQRITDYCRHCQPPY